MRSFLLQSAPLVLGFSCLPAVSLQAAPTAEAAWQEVLHLDAGPPPPPPLEANASSMLPAKAIRERYTRHLMAQEKALRAYAALPDSSEHSFEARFRLARVLSLRAELEDNPTLQTQSNALLDALEAVAAPDQKAHIAFTRVTQKMRSHRLPSKEVRAELLKSARAFLSRFPSDPRGARLLVEIATQFDRDPGLKRSLLKEAAALSKEPQLHLRIEDDLRKLSLLGKPLPLKLPTLEVGAPDPLQAEGVPVLLLFYSEESIPSLAALDALNEALRNHPKIKRIAFSLDQEKKAVERIRKSSAQDWSMCWDEKGWNGPVARAYGINAVPTVWLLDSKGRLQSLNALEDLSAQLAAASKEAGL